jgi:type II secretory pathway pseudopilin PulG
MKRRTLPPARPARQRGVFGVLFAIILPVMLGMIGLAVDLSMMYARGHEMQSVADSAALAAARALDGTLTGLMAAKDRARATAIQAQYRFLNNETVSWSSAALSFGASAEGPWIPADAVNSGDLPTLFFAMVDTSQLDRRYGTVALSFLKVVKVDGVQYLSRRAVAGRKDSALGPLAVCALDTTEIGMRSNGPGYDEALEYGFRRGVTYNLLNLNPNGVTPKSYAINPLDFAPAPDMPAHLGDAALRPFVCSGTIPAPPLGNGAMLYVREPFPSSMVTELNSRFADYGDGSVCTKFGSPPDSNIVDYRGYTSFWMTNPAWPVHASADPLIAGGKLVTVADALGVAPGTTAASYGTLWSFGKPLRYSGGAMGSPFTKNDWSKLYPVSSGLSPASNYSAALSPYERNLPPHRLLPTPLTGNSARRILNVPLLACPVLGSSARMLGIGRFLMTTPATSSPLGVHAEFGGLTTYGALTASAVLYQ